MCSLLFRKERAPVSMTEACGVCLCICEHPMVYVTLASDGEFPKFTRPYGVFDGLLLP